MRNLILAAAVMAAAGAAGAAEAEKPAMTVSAQQSLAQVLAAAQAGDVPVTVNLEGGAQYAGRVKEAGSAAVVLSRVAGKEFYDVYIPLDKISSVELRVRNK